VVIQPQALIIQEFKKIWEKDKTKSKDNAIEDLSFVFFASDHQSMYKNYAEEIRFKKIQDDVITQKDWKVTSDIEKAILKYKDLHKTYSMGLLEDAEFAVEKIRHYLRNVDMSEDEKGIKTKTLINNVKSLGELIRGLNLLKEQVEKEISEAGRIRGGGTLGAREIPHKTSKYGNIKSSMHRDQEDTES
jgi:hypothetical protein